MTENVMIGSFWGLYDLYNRW